MCKTLQINRMGLPLCVCVMRGGGAARVKEMGWQKAGRGKNQDDSKMG